MPTTCGLFMISGSRMRRTMDDIQGPLYFSDAKSSCANADADADPCDF